MNFVFLIAWAGLLLYFSIKEEFNAKDTSIVFLIYYLIPLFILLLLNDFSLNKIFSGGVPDYIDECCVRY